MPRSRHRSRSFSPLDAQALIVWLAELVDLLFGFPAAPLPQAPPRRFHPAGYGFARRRRTRASPWLDATLGFVEALWDR